MAQLLIAEDDELLRDALADLLVHSGYSVRCAADGAEACSLLASARFDGVILDLGLPKRDGMDVLRWIRQNLMALPVLIVTARDGVDDRVQGLNAGADDYLTKPFIMAELQARLQAMLRRSRLPAFGGSLEIVGAGSTRLRVDATQPRAWGGGLGGAVSRPTTPPRLD
jgi:two-component system, OmpR family, response regulator